jgi:hypothetical protein
LARLVVVRSYEQESVGTNGVGLLCELEGFFGGIRSSASHDGYLARGVFHRALNDFDVLGVVEGGGFARGANGDESIDALVDLKAYQFL